MPIQKIILFGQSDIENWYFDMSKKIFQLHSCLFFIILCFFKDILNWRIRVCGKENFYCVFESYYEGLSGYTSLEVMCSDIVYSAT